MSNFHTAEAGLQQSEQAALQALTQLLHIWYREAGLHGMLRSLDATLAQCQAIRDEFAAEDQTTNQATDLNAERGAISQHLSFMLELCAD